MKYQLACLALLAAACGSPPPTATPAGQTAAPAEDSEADMMARIDRFLADPKAEDVTPIMEFMRNSPKVMVVIDQRLDVAYADAGLSDDVKRLLRTAFVAGNMRAQLKSGVKENAPVDGVRGMLSAYAALKSKDESLSSAAVETLAEKEAAGTLEEHVKALLAE